MKGTKENQKDDRKDNKGFCDVISQLCCCCFCCSGTEHKEDDTPPVLLDTPTLEKLQTLVSNKQIHCGINGVPMSWIKFVWRKLQKGPLQEYRQNAVGRDDIIFVFGTLCTRIEDDTQAAVEDVKIQPDEKNKVVALMFHLVGANRTIENVKDCSYKHDNILDTFHIPFKDI
ncbi:uncharacterized protein LOC128241883 isoform X2 [Mya arenaria]|uniref:uncharacterized protein LOC128241883 isoform X2 n=1 Tax=Mya arenaria TaxID=6604 RepID=UPI0022E7CDD1|nr:uncharacterized protein LOC128241883 isoform X2 [Mya arenaria]